MVQEISADMMAEGMMPPLVAMSNDREEERPILDSDDVFPPPGMLSVELPPILRERQQVCRYYRDRG